MDLGRLATCCYLGQARARGSPSAGCVYLICGVCVLNVLNLCLETWGHDGGRNHDFNLFFLEVACHIVTWKLVRL